MHCITALAAVAGCDTQQLKVAITGQVHERDPNASFELGSWRWVYHCFITRKVNNSSMEQ
jgi:hypothetical protein